MRLFTPRACVSSHHAHASLHTSSMFHTARIQPFSPRVQVPIKRGRFQFRRLDGTMNVPARERAITDFEERNEVMVLLVSRGALACVGLPATSSHSTKPSVV
eukprot:365454-Chlamydomonas_euryale.AAC.1